MPVLAPAALPTTPPLTVTTTTGGGDNRQPCFVCGALSPISGLGSSWPWTGPGRRICEPCLRNHDQRTADQ